MILLITLISINLSFCSATDTVSLALLPSTVCPYGKAIFTCTTTSGRLRWTIDGVNVYYNEPEDINQDPIVVSNWFTVNLTKVEGNEFVSTVTVDSVSFDLDGESVVCADTALKQTTNQRTAEIKLAFPPSVPIPTGFDAVNFTSAVLMWEPPTDIPQCAHNYTVTITRITSDALFSIIRNANETFATVSGLNHGVEYAFVVVGKDRAGRSGNTSQPMHFILDVPERVKNFIVTLVHTSDSPSIHIQWEMVISYRPQLTHYLLRHNDTADHSTAVLTVDRIQHNITINSSTTNIMTRAVFVEITPFNALGAGIPSTSMIVVNQASSSVVLTAIIESLLPTVKSTATLKPDQNETELLSTKVLVLIAIPWGLLVLLLSCIALYLFIAKGKFCCTSKCKSKYLKKPSDTILLTSAESEDDSVSSDAHSALYDEVQRGLATKYSAASSAKHCACTVKRNPAYSVLVSKPPATASTKL